MKNMNILKNIALFFTVALFLTSCVETVVVGSVATNIIATREKSIKDTGKDTWIAAKIDKDILANVMVMPKNSVKVMVNEGRVLLVGRITDLEKGKKIYEIAWNTKGVVEVIDEIQINQEKVRVRDFSTPFTDSYLTTRIKAKLFWNQDVTGADFKICSSYGNVYVFGVAKNEAEMSEALRVVSNVTGVKKVINHAILNEDSRRRS